MSINATSSSVSSTSSSAQVSNASSTEAQKAGGDSSFKEEMDKVTTSEKTDNEQKSVEQNKDLKKDNTEQKTKEDTEDQNLTLEGNIDYSNFASKSMLDMNSMLAGDIRQMMNSNTISSLYETNNTKSNMFSLDFSNSISMDSSDADFFLNLTQKNDISMQNISAQAQNMINNGADVKEVKQNVQVSQTLLNALSNARENNQPVRIDFDQNISVILRVGKDGAIAATFIPGDKAVEQYLRNNIASLKATFDENDLPYSDLSYSNRGSKQQKEQRKNNDK